MVRYASRAHFSLELNSSRRRVMRVNIYAEELTPETEFVSKVLEDGRTVYAVRLFFKSASELHHTVDDDDRSAITFWVPWTKELGNNPEQLEGVLNHLCDTG